MEPKAALALLVSFILVWVATGHGLSYLMGSQTVCNPNIMVSLCLFFGLLVSLLLYNGHTTLALMVYIICVAASTANILNLKPRIKLAKRPKWKPWLLGTQARLWIMPYSEQCFYIPILFFLMIPRLQPVSSIVQAINLQSTDEQAPYISLIDPALAMLFIILSSWSNVAIRRQARQNTLRSLFKHSCLYTCLFIQFLLNDNKSLFYHDTNVFRILTFRRSLNVSQLEYFSNILLFFAALLVTIEQFLSRIPQNWYANCVSILNLFCGLLGIHFLISPPQSATSSNLLGILVLSCIMVGQLFDLFDGRVAEKWGSTKNGELFDDVADATSFGLAVGLLIRHVSRSLMSSSEGSKLRSDLWPIIIAGIYIFCVFYRLVRFVLNKRAQCVKGGVYFFFGLPSPATATMAGLLCVLFEQDWTFSRVWTYNLSTSTIKQISFSVSVLILCLLTVSNIPYPHLGRVLYRRGVLPQSFRISIEALFVVSAIYGMYYRTPLLMLYCLGSLSVLYLFTPVYADKLGWYNRDFTVKEKHKETLFLVQQRKVARLEQMYTNALAKLKKINAQAPSGNKTSSEDLTSE
ncbi:CDP-diacylglycerol--serine O-phosphatidyltransferase [Giardia duodenalis]|uniref:Phosphatidylserine synthase n=2 Tax=Giardia intestinalis TaxID=5741 RepID=C6LQA5_GIAIB|nr:Phosphatidylserine synthase [Giardia intestinalis ATCC 50581]ESU44706.1 CDP-diacylglycerol--serine O-phosphatidyltransferase [Giardia intestinalis]